MLVVWASRLARRLRPYLVGYPPRSWSRYATKVTNRTLWSLTTIEDHDLIPGKDVYSRDGEKVGSVKDVWHPETEFPASRGQHYFLMDPGMFREWFGGFDKFYLPESSIESVTSDRIVVNMTKDQIKQAGWTEQPFDWDRYRRN
jgi:sporulation protein YlmC with PRC-barrel domain